MFNLRDGGTPWLLFILLFATGCAVSERSGESSNLDSRPNVILVIADDQGYGDVGFHGNERIRTPSLDQLSRQSVEFTRFYVSPVCAPTRASLMTGRYNYRTGVTDTYLGRAMMHGDEVTVAESLSEAGYRTGIFGKWHLGDNYPLRPMDQGFHHSLVHRGGGIGQPSDPPDNTYTDPILLRNGREVQEEGYCTDIFFREALEFMALSETPFFAYIATNAPHTPLQIDQSLVRPYLEQGLDGTTARVYAMITNIDENMGRLRDFLKAEDLEENTLLIFMTDNGHQQPRYSAGLRGRKGTVFEGGIRVPFLLRWPTRTDSGTSIETPAAHVDLLPTLLDACDVSLPQDHKIDGLSLLPHLENSETPDLHNRPLFFQWHRGDEPEFGRACAVVRGRFKLVQDAGHGSNPMPENPSWHLFDLIEDPGEEKDVSQEHPEVFEELQAAYADWFEEVSSTRGYKPPRIHIGSVKENPVTLTRQDWRGPRASWRPEGLGHWLVRVDRAGEYEIELRFPPLKSNGEASLHVGDQRLSKAVGEGAGAVSFADIRLPEGDTRVEATIESEGQSRGAHYVQILRK